MTELFWWSSFTYIDNAQQCIYKVEVHLKKNSFVGILGTLLFHSFKLIISTEKSVMLNTFVWRTLILIPIVIFFNVQTKFLYSKIYLSTTCT